MNIEMPQISPAGKYNTAQAAEILGVDRRTILRWHKSGKLRGIYNGNRKYYKGEALIRAYNTH